MRRIALVIAFLGLTGTLIAQVALAPDSPIRKVLIGNSPITDITFGRAERGANNVTEMSGGVRFKVNGTEVSADAATVDLRAGEIRLRGDVRLKLNQP